MESRLAHLEETAVGANSSARFKSLLSAALLIIYIFLWIVYSSELRFFASLPFAALFFLVPVAGLLAYRYSRQRQDAFFFLALSFPTLPFFSYHVLEIFLLSFLSCSELCRLFPRRGHKSAEEVQLPLASLLFSVSLLISSLTALRSQADLWNLGSIISQSGFSGALAYLWSDPRSWSATALVFSGEVLAILLFRELARQRVSSESQISFIRGLGFGGLLSGLILLLQFVGPAVFSFNRGAFWHISGRYPASFSDPNAAGIFAALVLPFFWRLGKNLSGARILHKGTLYSIAYLLIAAFSGSRTFLLALGLYFLISLSRKKSFLKILLLLASGLIVLAYPPLNKSLAALSQTLFHLPTLERILQTLNWEQASSMLSNRFLYARLALRVWFESPI